MTGVQTCALPICFPVTIEELVMDPVTMGLMSSVFAFDLEAHIRTCVERMQRREVLHALAFTGRRGRRRRKYRRYWNSDIICD